MKPKPNKTLKGIVRCPKCGGLTDAVISVRGTEVLRGSLVETSVIRELVQIRCRKRSCGWSAAMPSYTLTADSAVGMWEEINLILEGER